MNAIELFSLNKHGGYQEVLFSSLLSYLLNPEFDHKIGTSFLSSITKLVNLKVEGKVICASEKNLGLDIGNIDQFIISDLFVLGIEVKIWDRSSRNISKKGEHQLKRYAWALSKLSESQNIDWKLLFIIPDWEAEVSIQEFVECHKLYPGNSYVATWMKGKTQKIEGAINISISELLDDLLVDLDDEITKWLIKSVTDFIKSGKLKTISPESGIFPTRRDLMRECPDYWKLLEPWIEHTKRTPNSNHTTIGIPYGGRRLQNPKASLHNNSLYRIRTANDYYSTLAEKRNHIPKPPLILELWIDVYDHCNDELSTFCASSDGISLTGQGIHIDSYKKTPIMLMEIERPLSGTEIEEFESILREGFKNLIENDEVKGQD